MYPVVFTYFNKFFDTVDWATVRGFGL